LFCFLYLFEGGNYIVVGVSKQKNKTKS